MDRKCGVLFRCRRPWRRGHRGDSAASSRFSKAKGFRSCLLCSAAVGRAALQPVRSPARRPGGHGRQTEQPAVPRPGRRGALRPVHQKQQVTTTGQPKLLQCLCKRPFPWVGRASWTKQQHVLSSLAGPLAPGPRPPTCRPASHLQNLFVSWGKSALFGFASHNPTSCWSVGVPA